MRNLFFASVLGAVLMSGCVSATVSDDFCKHSTLSTGLQPTSSQLPPISSVNVSLPPLTYSTSIDLSDNLKKFSDVADTVDLTITKNLLTVVGSDFSFVEHVEVLLDAGSNNSVSPIQLVEYDATSADSSSSTLSLPLLVDSNTLYAYLSQGPVNITFVLSLNSNVQNAPTGFESDICGTVSADVHKSL